MKKLVILVMLIVLMVPASISAAEKQATYKVTTSPETPTIVNGVAENQIFYPMSSYGPFFEKYTPNSSPSVVSKFKEIATYEHDNRLNDQPFQMQVSVQRSTRQGSEFSGSVTFSGEIKAGILGKIGTQVSGGVKEYRETNEAVGVQGSYSVPAGKTGVIKFWYKGRSTAGTLRYSTYHNALGDYVYTDVAINAKVHPQILDVESQAYSY